MRGLQSELQKAGRLVSRDDFGDYGAYFDRDP